MDRPAIIDDHKKRTAATYAAEIQRYGRQRTVAIADNFDRTGLAQKSCNQIDAAMLRLIELCYKIDPDVDTQTNIDTTTLQLLIPVPWGRRYTDYALRYTEANVLRLHIQRLQIGQPLFVYNADMRRWHLSHHYSKKSLAINYWTQRGITAEQYLQYARATRTQRGHGAEVVA